MAEVSIILPTYNRAKVISRSIKSIINQTFKNFELIIIDDGNDDTEKIVKEFSDDRIIYIKNPKRLGVSFARNQGINMSTGKYIGFIDSDDVWLSTKLEFQINSIKNLDNTFGVVYSSVIIEGKKRKKIEFHDLGSGNLSNRILSRWPPLGAILIRRKCFERTGYFDQNIHCGEDIDFLIRVSQHYKFYYLDKPLLIIYPSDNSLSKNKFLDLTGRKKRIYKHFTLYRRNPVSLSKEFLYIGFCYAFIGSINNCRANIINAIRVYPFKPKYYIAYILSLIGDSFFRKIIKVMGNII